MVQMQHNMVAAQNMVQTLLGSDNSPKGKKVETTIYHTKQPQLSVIHMTAEDTECTLSNVTI
jgi:hypothetical protein